MNRTKLRYADGYEEEIHESVDPMTTVLTIHTPDGLVRYFKATDEIDEDGCDVYVEESE